MYGGLGVDYLNGGNGNDTLVGTAGFGNTLVGGPGSDMFVPASTADLVVPGPSGPDEVANGSATIGVAEADRNGTVFINCSLSGCSNRLVLPDGVTIIRATAGRTFNARCNATNPSGADRYFVRAFLSNGKSVMWDCNLGPNNQPETSLVNVSTDASLYPNWFF